MTLRKKPMKCVASLYDLDPPFVEVHIVFYFKRGHTALLRTDTYNTWVSAVKAVEDFAQNHNFDLEWEGIDVSKIKSGEIR